MRASCAATSDAIVPLIKLQVLLLSSFLMWFGLYVVNSVEFTQDSFTVQNSQADRRLSIAAGLTAVSWHGCIASPRFPTGLTCESRVQVVGDVFYKRSRYNRYPRWPFQVSRRLGWAIAATFYSNRQRFTKPASAASW